MYPDRRWGLTSLVLLALFSLPRPTLGQASGSFGDVGGEMTLTLAGDAIITRKLSVYDEPEFLRLRALVEGATAAYVNLEVLFHRFEEDVIPASVSGGTYMQADPTLAAELTWMGFDMVSRANNHTMDYGLGGLRHTDEAVEAVGLMHAGTGENLARARAPGYLETPRGRVALISAASTFADHMRAGPQHRDVRGRPGLNPIRFRTTYQITSEQMEALGTFREGMGFGRGSGDRIRMFGETFQLGEEYQALSEPLEEDLREVLASVEEAKRQADFVIFSSHSHERGRSNSEPAGALVTLAHAVIDAGADIFLAHGPHVLRGLEIYRGKPIFYSLGDFMFQPETVPFQPGDNYRNYDLGSEAVAPDFFDARQRNGGFPANPLIWESIVARVRFQDGVLSEIELFPITLGHGLERPQRGRPLLATGTLGDKIIADLQELSEPFGTEIKNQNGVGVVGITGG